MQRIQQHMIVLCGLPGSGKTTISQQLAALGYVWVNQDTLGNRKKCEEAVRTALSSGQSVVVDRCNFDVPQRSTWIRLAYDVCGDGIQITCVALIVDPRECIERGLRRVNHPTLQGSKMAPVVNRMRSQWVDPTPSEGFHTLLFAADPPSINNVVQMAAAFLGHEPPHPHYPATNVPHPKPLFEPPQHRQTTLHEAFKLPPPAPPPLPYTTQWRSIPVQNTHHQPHEFFAPLAPPNYDPHVYHQIHPPPYDPPYHPIPPPFHPADHTPSAFTPPHKRSYHPHPPPHHQHEHATHPHHPTYQHPPLATPTTPPHGPRHSPPTRHHTPSKRGSQLDADPSDPRPILLFDLNGTLTSHTSRRKSSGRNRLRPGTSHLLRLQPHFRIGIFTSSTARTVATVVEMLEGEVGRAFLDPGLILFRDHTAPCSKEHVAAGGDPWDTVKPLGSWFTRLHRVVLFDDDAYKSVAGEESNMVLVPCWEDEDADCTLIGRLVDAVLAALGDIGPEGDVREFTARISSEIKGGSKAGEGRGVAGGVVVDDSPLP